MQDPKLFSLADRIAALRQVISSAQLRGYAQPQDAITPPQPATTVAAQRAQAALSRRIVRITGATIADLPVLRELMTNACEPLPLRNAARARIEQLSGTSAQLAGAQA